MANKDTNLNMNKEQERSELHRTIWQIANNLRGSIDGWDFKQYVLGMLFYRFISENLTKYINDEEHRAGEKEFDYIKLSDKEAEFGRADTVKEKGFYILPSELFINVTKNAQNNPNLNETLASIFKNIESSAKGTESEDDLKGLFDDLDVNSNKLGNTVEKRNKQLTKLLESIGGLSLGKYTDHTIDASAEFVHGGNKNKLSEKKRKKILETFENRKDIEYFSKLIDNKVIAENDYNIAVSGYIEAEDTREVINIEELNKKIEGIVKKQSQLRTAIDEIVADIEKDN